MLRLVLGHLLVWLLVAVPCAVGVFLDSSRHTVLASHDAVVRPTVDGEVTVRTGVILPDVRRAASGPVGVEVTLGKTHANSVDELVARYAFIASQPEAQVAKVRHLVWQMVWSALAVGAVLGVLPIGIWHLVGRQRRNELRRGGYVVPIGFVTAVSLWLAILAWQPWSRDADEVGAEATWISLDELAPEVPLPAEADGIFVQVDSTTGSARRLIASMVSTYQHSKAFYSRAVTAAAELDLHEPGDDETVALLVSDRHDNIGMDPVARAIADAGGASIVLDGGDDTSTGSAWEAFSLDSLQAAFEDRERFSISGNHDHGSFVRDYLSDLGWTGLDGTVVEAPHGITLLGVDDPRSSGLGNWRDETGLSFDEQADRLADEACSGPRIATILVHDANSGAEALDRGCVDLVLGGHTHIGAGPTRVVGDNGAVGYTYTNGTTGGAAYAIAVGSKLKRDAQVTLVTYRDGRPVGVQPVTLRTDGVFVVGDYRHLAPADAQK